MPEEILLVHYWGTQAPLRMFLSMGLVFYSFFFSQSSPLYSSASMSGFGSIKHPSAHVRNDGYQPSGWGGDGLKNRIFFTFIFVEFVSWFWVWVTIREERREYAINKARRRGSVTAR